MSDYLLVCCFFLSGRKFRQRCYDRVIPYRSIYGKTFVIGNLHLSENLFLRLDMDDCLCLLPVFLF